MIRESSFDAIRYENLSKYYKYAGVHDSIWNWLFYLFRRKLVDLMVFSFLQGKMCASEKSAASRKFYAPERSRSASCAYFSQNWDTRGVFRTQSNIYDGAFLWK